MSTSTFYTCDNERLTTEDELLQTLLNESNTDVTNEEFSFTFQDAPLEEYNISFKSTDNESIENIKFSRSTIRRRVRLKLRLNDDQVDVVTVQQLFKELFLDGGMLAVLRDICNSRLLQLNETFCNEQEVMQAVTVVIGAAFYSTSVTELLKKENEVVCNAPKVNRKRILLNIRSMEGNQANVNGTHHSAVDGQDDIERLEEVFYSILRQIGYVPGMNLSADDDLVRLRSRKVTEVTNLKQIIIPGKRMPY